MALVTQAPFVHMTMFEVFLEILMVCLSTVSLVDIGSLWWIWFPHHSVPVKLMAHKNQQPKRSLWRRYGAQGFLMFLE